MALQQRVAFLGLGTMGYPMAGHLLRHGYEVTVYNRTVEKAQRWCDQYGGEWAATISAAVDRAELVFACVGDDHDIRQLTLGPEGAFDAMSPGAIFVDHTTTSAKVARELSQILEQRGCSFLDAPVSGGQAGAENGVLTVMVGGRASVFEQVAETLSCYARAVTYLGASGSGQLCKMVNQICIAGVLQGLAEGVHFAQSAGLDVERVIDVISQGAAQSWQMQNRYQTMLAGEYEHGFAVDWMRKDLAIVLDEAKANTARLPLTALVDQFYGDVQAMGGRRWDTSSLLRRLQALGQLERGVGEN